jgi:hypothetical protein
MLCFGLMEQRSTFNKQINMCLAGTSKAVNCKTGSHKSKRQVYHNVDKLAGSTYVMDNLILVQS